MRIVHVHRSLPVFGLGLLLPLGCGALEPPEVPARDRPAYLERAAGPASRAAENPAGREAALPDLGPGPLTVERALAIAEGGNPALAALEREAAAARGRELQAGLLPNPVAFAETEDGPLYRETGSSKFVGGLAYTFPVGGRVAAAEAAAGKAREAAEATLALGRRVLRAEVRAAFAAGLAWQARLALVDELVEIAWRSREIAERRVHAGDAPQAEQLKAEVELERLVLDRATVESDLLGAKRQLATLLGRADAPVPALAGVLPTASSEIALPELKARVLRDFPRIHALTRAWEAARFDLLLARRERIPDVTLAVGAGSSPEVRDTKNEPLLEVGLSVPLPIFDRNQGRIAEAEANVGRAAREAEAGLNEVLFELEEDHRRHAIARERVRRYEAEILPRAELSLEQARLGYQAGKLRFLDVLDAQRTLGDARALYLDALRDLAVARAELDKFIGE